MALRLARMTYKHEPTAFSPEGYIGTFWDTVTSTFVQRAVTQPTVVDGATLETVFEATHTGDTFDWTTPAPPAP